MNTVDMPGRHDTSRFAGDAVCQMEQNWLQQKQPLWKGTELTTSTVYTGAMPARAGPRNVSEFAARRTFHNLAHGAADPQSIRLQIGW